jgi:hypothetical protein
MDGSLVSSVLLFFLLSMPLPAWLSVVLGIFFEGWGRWGEGVSAIFFSC